MEPNIDQEKMWEYINESISAEQDMFAPDFVENIDEEYLWDFINDFNLKAELENYNDIIIKETLVEFIKDNYLDEFVNHYSDEFQSEFKCWKECN